MIALSREGYELTLDPGRGGSIVQFTWQGMPLLRETLGPGILDAACFPLAPWSNRIAEGRFVREGPEVVMPPNFPAVDPRHPLHGPGWLSPWRIVAAERALAVLELIHEAGEWPWRFRARQRFELTANGLRLALSVTNLDASAMPAGLGLHPYFPRTERTLYRGLHRGMWRNSPDRLPLHLEEATAARDWWGGEPVGTMPVDTVFAGRHGRLEIVWPERGLSLKMTPSAPLAFTAVHAPENAAWFCAEPVSHITDAINSGRAGSGLARLDPGESLSAGIRFQAFRL